MSKAASTRLTILQKAFELVYRKGYQSTSIDEIIATTQVTKGAFFYHFKNKDEMGLAMINEVMYPGMYHALIHPLLETVDPATEIFIMMETVLLKSPFFKVKYGCPAINLIDEMSPLKPAFNKALARLPEQWQKAIQKSIKNGMAAGNIRKDANPKQVAYFIIAGYGGIRNMGKIWGPSCYKVYLQELKSYLKKIS